MDYKELISSYKTLLDNAPSEISLLANTSAYIYEVIPNLNWAGFYLFNKKELILGPFQGRVACEVIPLKKGVCGEAAFYNKTIIVDDVLNYENHIACDANSRSEIVVPIYVKNELYGVLDVDSPSYNRFDNDLKGFFETIVALMVSFIDKS